MDFIVFLIVIYLIINNISSASQLEEVQNNPYIMIVSYFKTVKPHIIIFKFLITYVLYFFFNLCFILSLFYYSPNHLFISTFVSKITAILLNPIYNNKLIVFILFILSFFCLLIYLEIIELNFYGLNKNVKRNIGKRANDEVILSKSLETEMIDISMDEYEPGYYTKKNYGEPESFGEQKNGMVSGGVIN